MVGLAAVPGTTIDCPRIADAPVAFGCRRHVSVAVSGAREIIPGRIEMAHVGEDIIDLDTHYSDTRRLDAIGRMDRDRYCSTRDLVDLAIPSVAEVESGRPRRTGSAG